MLRHPKPLIRSTRGRPRVDPTLANWSNAAATWPASRSGRPRYPASTCWVSRTSLGPSRATAPRCTEGLNPNKTWMHQLCDGAVAEVQRAWRGWVARRAWWPRCLGASVALVASVGRQLRRLRGSAAYPSAAARAVSAAAGCRRLRDRERAGARLREGRLWGGVHGGLAAVGGVRRRGRAPSR
jgi:hypothetical protein